PLAGGPRDAVQLAADAAPSAARGMGGPRPAAPRRGDAVSWGRALVAIFRSNDRRFIELLCQQADLNLELLGLLPRFVEKGVDGKRLAESMKDVERQADEVRRILIDELTQTYATPFDREDLFALSRSIDDVADAIDEAAFELELYGVVPGNLE